MSRQRLQHLRALQRDSVGILLVRAGQLWSERVMSLVNAEAGVAAVREAHLRIFPHLLVDGGARITDLAAALHVTKQAVQPVVAELAERGLVALHPDPLDARAKRVVLTDLGVAAMVHGTGITMRVQAELSPDLGQRDVETLRRILKKLIPLLERPSPPDEGRDRTPRRRPVAPRRRSRGRG